MFLPSLVHIYAQEKVLEFSIFPSYSLTRGNLRYINHFCVPLSSLLVNAMRPYHDINHFVCIYAVYC